MKLSTFIALLKTYPQDADVTLLGVQDFYIYYYKDYSRNVSSILLDTEILDDSDIEKSDSISLLKILDTKLVHSSFDKQNNIVNEDDIKMHKAILKGLDDSDK
jgi:hypothetical protein